MTQVLQKAVVINPSRVHDYLYDNHFVVSSERDHARSTFKAHTSSERVKRVPIYKTMFSELRHHPRFQLRLDTTDPVPKFMNRQWRGYADQQREALIRYKTFNYAPDVEVPGIHYDNPKVRGTNRYKYFRRPIIPFLQQVPPEVLLATARQDPLANADMIVERPPTPLTRTVEVQTDYRDSEAQTDPYTPEYVIRPGSAPELLTLATLSYGRGLPAGLAEVEMIERARAKRAWEATLPPLNDISQADKRRKMMDEMETKEWALREEEIEKLQEARLEVLKKLLQQREENHQELNIKRLDALWSKKQEEKSRMVKKIRHEHIKMIRKLTEKRRKVEGKLEKKDVVHEYSDFGSQVYAPLTRIGVFLDRGSEQYNVKSRYLNTYQGLLELEHSLPDYVLNPRFLPPRPRTVTKSGFVKRKYRQEQELAEIHQIIKNERTEGDEPVKPLRFLQKIEKPVPRPPTPAIEVPSDIEEEKELAVIFLQQCIRGRAIQNMMFEGKEKRMELIKELRSTHALQEAEQTMKKQEKQATLALQRQRRLFEHKESIIDEALSNCEGQSLGDMLDFLSKELIRLQEERRIHAFAMLAERDRRIREAEESGRRQVEERRRREEDEIFKQTVKVHQNTVDTYLEDIILGAVDKTADIQSRYEIHQVAEKVNDVAFEMEEKRNKLESEEIVSELVHCFLLPEVQKETVRERVRMQQRKYIQAAHHEIHKDGEETIDKFAKSTDATETKNYSSSRKSSAASVKSVKNAWSGTEDKEQGMPAAATSRPTSAASAKGSVKTSSRPVSAASEKVKESSRPASATSRTSAKESIKTSSRPASAASEKEVKESSRPASAASRTSVKESIKTSSRPASAASEKESKMSSRPASRASAKESVKTSSRPASAASEKDAEVKDASRPASQNSVKSGNDQSKPGSSKVSPVASRSSTPRQTGSKAASPTGSAKVSPRADSEKDSPDSTS